jgi:hypothetical protein
MFALSKAADLHFFIRRSTVLSHPLQNEFPDIFLADRHLANRPLADNMERTLTEGEGSVQLTTSLRYLVLLKSK